MASSIASPVPQSFVANRSMRKDVQTLQPHDDGRGTPLPQYEKTQSVPFTLTLQEEKDKPGQFQLVVNVDSQHQRSNSGNALKLSPSTKLVANLKEPPSLGYDVSQLYHTQKSSPPSTPQDDRQEWSELDAIPPDFLEKVVPDWKLTFSRSDSTASTQSRRLADIKARIKKSGKGFVVRLLKGSTSDANEVAEVHLGQDTIPQLPTVPELDSSAPAAELDSANVTSIPPSNSPGGIFEIGSSGQPGIEQQTLSTSSATLSSIPQWISQTSSEAGTRLSIQDDSFSDAETLLADVRSIADRMEDRTDSYPISIYGSTAPTRSSSIIKTPTRGLSVVGPVQRVQKTTRSRPKGIKTRMDLGRSGARKSFIGRSPQGSISVPDSTQHLRNPTAATKTANGGQVTDSSSSEESSGSASCRKDHTQRRTQAEHQETPVRKARRQQSALDIAPPARLRLDTKNLARPRSTNTSPVSVRKRPARLNRSAASSPLLPRATDNEPAEESPAWSEVDPTEADEIRVALERAFDTNADNHEPMDPGTKRSIPRIEEPVNDGAVGNFDLPAGYEVRSAPVSSGNRVSTYFGLALGALLDTMVEGLHQLRDRYGSEPPVPAGQVRVRWTCSCGEALYDDFVERRPGAARWLEGYLNRPRTHTPIGSHSRTSTSTSMSSLFDNVSRASTLPTPSSTYGGPSSWGRNDTSKYSPTQVKSNSSFSVTVRPPVEDSWLLTCANEGRFTPKIVHLDVNEHRVRSDRDLAIVLRQHYEQLNRRWLKWTRLRGLTTIEFVQFEVHRNRFADIRATPSMPPTSSPVSDKSPSHHPYSFEPSDLMPPVGSKYLLHLFMHPEDYDEELVTYKRAPKRRERLQFGMGWGINLVEGFQAQKVWAFIMGCFGIGSGVFAIIWTIKKGDVQGAFGVAGWIVTLAVLVLGALQAWLE